MARNKADKEPTKTSIVLKTLVDADDFITAAQLVDRLTGKVNSNQISASLHHLRNRNAISCMESDGRLWWYSTPDLDDRSRVLIEKVVETSPRRTRGVPVVKHASSEWDDRPPKAKVVKLRSKLQESLREANDIADRMRKNRKEA